MKKRLQYTLTTLFMFFVLASVVLATGEIVQDANRLNYWTAENHTVTVNNTGTASSNVTIAIPTGFTWVSGTTCTNIGTDIQCLLDASASGTYTVQSPGATSSEYEVDRFIVATNNSYTGSVNVSMLRIQCGEIFHTLVEFGRGRGNYFYNSGSGKAGSGQTETGCPYLPNGTFVELNFLHKTYNVKQYFNVVADAYNATYTCTYPNNTIVRQHLDTSIARSSVWSVDYFIDEIGGSWERFGYLGMQYDVGDYGVGSNITINCTDIQYELPIAGGNMSCGEDSFDLQFRDRNPFIASATAVGTVYNGTQEIVIAYTITNNESYTVSDVAVEIKAPDYAQFVGTRGELWGTAQDIYRFERGDFLASESETITLVARFNTSAAPGITVLNLTRGISIEHITCWEYNAYNPAEYIQDITATGAGGGGPGGSIGNITVNMSQGVTIVNIYNYINNIYNMVTNINGTVYNINTTVYNILTLSEAINGTVFQINITVTGISNNVTLIYNDTQTLIDLLNCNGSVDSPICGNLTAIISYVTNINNTVNNIQSTVNQINSTVDNIENFVTNINTTVGAINGNVSILINTTTNIYNMVNCTNITSQWQNSTCNRLNRIENYSYQILTNITNIWGGYNVTDILDAINNISVSINITGDDITSILTEIRRLREFDEELVFLVTDAFNANQRASSAAGSGDMSTAMTELQNARLNLDKAAVRLDYLRAQGEANAPGKWWVWLILVALIIVVMIYLFQRVPDEQPPKYKF